MQNPNFVKPKKLGCGAYGIVYSNKKDEAVKITEIDSWDKLQSTLREIHALRQLATLSNKSYVSLKRVKFFRNKMHVFMNKADTNLSNMCFKNVSAETIESYTIQLFQGLFAMRKHRIFHRDIKPENILVDLQRSRLYYCDFGLSRQFHDDNVDYGTGYIVTRWYRSPELIKHQKEHKRKANLKYTEKMDVWSLGCILYEMLFQKVLAPGKDVDDVLKLINRHVNKLKYEELIKNNKITPNVAKCLLGCLKIDFNNRFNCARALHALGELEADAVFKYQDNVSTNKVEFTVKYASIKPVSDNYSIEEWNKRSELFSNLYKNFPSQKRIIAYSIVLYDNVKRVSTILQHWCNCVIYSALVLGSYYNNKLCHNMIEYVRNLFELYKDKECCWKNICQFTEEIITEKVSVWEQDEHKSFTSFLRNTLQNPLERTKKRIKIN